MNKLYRPESVSQLGVALFMAKGATNHVARATVDSLVTSSLMGHDSHGVIRIPEYLDFVADGSIVVDAEVTIERTGPSTAIVDCHRGFGAIGAARAVVEAVQIARKQRTACVLTRRCNHVGRMGAWVQIAADAGMVAIATCNSPVYGHDVLPFGGREGRLGTNPVAYAVPTGGDPLISDFSTSIAPEGKIRFARNQGKPLPDGWILDADGNPTNDPNLFYGPPRGGILPLGGLAGHKGFALGLLAEILGTAMLGLSPTDRNTFGNGVCFFVVDPTAFCPLEEFRRRMDETVAYVKSSKPAPGVEEVLVPGELEFRTYRQRQKTGIPVDHATLEGLQNHGKRLDVDADRFLDPMLAP